MVRKESMERKILLTAVLCLLGMISFDESEFWIRQVKLHPKKAYTSVLKISKKIKGAFTGEVLDNTEGNLRVTVSPKNKTYAVSGKCVYNKKTGDLVYGAPVNGVLNIPKKIAQRLPEHR